MTFGLASGMTSETEGQMADRDRRPAQQSLKETGPVGVICTVMNTQGLPWQGLLSCEHLALPAAGIQKV